MFWAVKIKGQKSNLMMFIVYYPTYTLHFAETLLNMQYRRNIGDIIIPPLLKSTLKNPPPPPNTLPPAPKNAPHPRKTPSPSEKGLPPPPKNAPLPPPKNASHGGPGPPVLSCLFWRYLFKSKSIYGTVSLSILLWKCTLRSLSVSSANLVLRFLIVITYYSSRASLPHVCPSEIHSPNIKNILCP